MAVEDKVLGGAFMVIALLAFGYYTMWTLVMVMTSGSLTWQTLNNLFLSSSLVRCVAIC